MKLSSISLLLSLHSLSGTNAFTAFTPFNRHHHHQQQRQATVTTTLHAAANRREVLSQAAAALVTASAAAFTVDVEPAAAFGALEKVNSQLKGYGLPTITSVSDGFSPLLELWGKGKNRSPLLVQFTYPSEWVVTLPSQDVNGEDGTIQAGQYSAGDTATLYVMEDVKVDNVAEESKSFFQDAITRAISQKGNNIYQDFKIKKVLTKEGEVKGQNYAVVDFSYTLLTGAGFEVDRVGVASVTSVGGSTEVLWCASTRQRYKKLEDKLHNIANSFRVYSDGLNFSSQRVEYDRDII